MEPKDCLLRDLLPRDAYIDDTDPAYKLLDKKVEVEFSGIHYKWPGKHKNVIRWWVLEDGHAVGWNENLSRGWSFPVVMYHNEKSHR